MEFSPLTLAIDPFGIWRTSVFLGLCLAAVMFVLRAGRRLPWSAKALWAYVIFSSLFILELPWPSFGKMHRAYEATAGQTLAEVILIPWLAIHYRKHIFKAIPWLLGVEAVLVTFLGYGVMHRESFDTALMALCLPFGPLGLVIPGILVILTRHGTTAMMIMGAQFLVLALQGRARWKATVFILVALAALAWHYHHGPWLDGGERLAAWWRYMGYWATNWKNIVFGMGAGSFMWTSLLIDEFNAPMFLQMHNDWLQILFEYGTIGLLLAVCTLRRVKREWVIGVASACVFALTYHPLRFFPSAVVVAAIFVEALSCRRS